MDAIDAASFFLGKSPSGAQNSTSPSETHTITGTATSDSADGLVMVDLEGYTVSADGEQSLELPTTVDVKEGDTVQVTLVGGTGKSPIVTGVVGGGDRLSNNVQDAVQTAQDAADAVAGVADVKKYFFHDDDGAHVTTVADEPDQGMNSLLDNTDLHFRNGTIDVARFGANGSQLGRDDEAHMVMDANSMELIDEYDSQFFFAGDRRDVTSGVAEVMNSFYADGNNSYLLSTSVDSVNYVKVDDVETTDYTLTQDTTFSGMYVLSFNYTVTTGSFIEISYNTTARVLAFSLGGKANGNNSVAESGSFAYGDGSHSEGVQSSTHGRSSHAEGYVTETAGLGSHSEGVETRANAEAAHAEGKNTLADGTAAHAEGEDTIANGQDAHAEGKSTRAFGACGHAEGLGTIAGSANQHAGGKYNVPEVGGAYAEVIGNGSASNARSNARTLDWNGNEELKGALYLGGCTANGEKSYPAPRYNTSASSLEYYDGSSWQSLKPPIKIQSFSKAVQIGGNAFVSTDLGTINTPTGYTYIGIVADNNGYGDQWLVSYSRYGNKCQAVIHSKYGGTLTSNLYAKAIFLRSDLMS